MAKFCTLCSSSSGNSTYIGDTRGGILVDTGINCKQLKIALASLNIAPETIKAIFLTHEHSDHITGLRVFASSYNIPVYATGGTLAALNNQGILNGKFPYEIMPAGGVEIDGIRITKFATSHDAKESCGYRIELDSEHIVAVATDTGVMTEEIINGIADAKIVLIESNYDEDMLTYGCYPLPLKARIRSEDGHLSNSDCSQTVLHLAQTKVGRHFVLGHLSRENNTPEKAYHCTHSALKNKGLSEEDGDFILSVAPAGCMPKPIIF